MNWSILPDLVRIIESGQHAVLVTVSKTSGSSPRDAGAKMIVLPEGKIIGTIGGGQLEHLAIQDALKILNGGGVFHHKYPLCIKAGQCCGGQVELMMEVLGDAPRFYLYGAGHVGQALCRVLKDSPFQVFVVDERKEWLDQCPGHVSTFAGSWIDFNATHEWDNNLTYVCIMTHSHDLDLEIVADVIDRNARHLGLIGSQTKWLRFQQRLKNLGFHDESIGRVKCPVGLNIGGKTPTEVAISIAAELIGLYHGKNHSHDQF